MEVHVNNHQASLNIDLKIWKAYLERLAVEMKCEVGTIVSLTFTDNSMIHELNQEYREIDRPTDVLSFPQNMENNLLGDIVISVEQAQHQAHEKSHSVETELAILVTHGFLHLLGYDHAEALDEKIMFGIQGELIKKYFEY